MEAKDEQELIAKYRVIKNNFERVNSHIKLSMDIRKFI